MSAAEVRTSELSLLLKVVRWGHANGWHFCTMGLRHVEQFGGWENQDNIVRVGVVDPHLGELVVYEREGRSDGTWSGYAHRYCAGSVQDAADFLVACKVLPAYFSSAFALADAKHEDRAAALEAEILRLCTANAELLRRNDELSCQLIDAKGCAA